MNNEQVPLVVPVTSPWLDTLLDALSRIQNTLLMVSPYIKDNAIAAIEQALISRASQQNRGIEIRVITRVNPNDFLSGASDIAALQQLLNWPIRMPGSTIEMRAIPNVHAKVWVCDRQLAIIGSGNATFPGLNSNLEYGLAVSDPQLVEHILSD
jgi:phosphatidylserine/phosphatidylglycerophosphate/cardiolipin synthase-like enzyme